MPGRAVQRRPRRGAEDVQHRVIEVGRGQRFDRRDQERRRVDDDDINRPELMRHGAEELERFELAPKVAALREHAPAELRKPGARLLERAGIARANGNTCPSLHELACDCPAKTTRTAADQGDLATERPLGSVESSEPCGEHSAEHEMRENHRGWPTRSVEYGRRHEVRLG